MHGVEHWGLPEEIICDRAVYDGRIIFYIDEIEVENVSVPPTLLIKSKFLRVIGQCLSGITNIIKFEIFIVKSKWAQISINLINLSLSFIGYLPEKFLFKPRFLKTCKILTSVTTRHYFPVWFIITKEVKLTNHFLPINL